MEKDRLIYNPPAWMVCEYCRGEGGFQDGPEPEDGYACKNCNGTGRIPIRYTPEQWQEAGGVLSDATPVWTLGCLWNGMEQEWLTDTFGNVKRKNDEYITIAIPGQDRPDEYWRPE